MRELRTVLVLVTPLLAGLIRYIVESRIKQPHARLSIIAEFDDPEQLLEQLESVDADLIIIGPEEGAAQHVADWAGSDAQVLTLSANLSRVSGPGADDVDPLTLDTLIRRLTDILRAT